MFKARSAMLLATVATTLIAVTCALAQDHWQDPAVGSVGLTQSGPIAQGLEVNRKVLDAIGVDRALLAFRIQAGLLTQDAKPLGGWARVICSIWKARTPPDQSCFFGLIIRLAPTSFLLVTGSLVRRLHGAIQPSEI